MDQNQLELSILFPVLFQGESPFTPKHISGLQLWLRADKGTFQDSAKTTAAVSDADVIGAWADQSGNGNDVLQATTVDKPTLRLSVTNGRSVIRFDGVTDFLSFADVFSSLVAAEIFVIIKIDADPPGDVAQSGLWALGSAAQNAHYPFTDGVIFGTFGTTARKTTGDPATNLAVFNAYNIVSTTSEWTSSLNGTQHFTTGTNTVGFSTTPNIGKSFAAGFLDGDVGEIIMYNSKLSSANRALIENYLNNRWGVVFS